MRYDVVDIAYSIVFNIIFNAF